MQPTPLTPEVLGDHAQLVYWMFFAGLCVFAAFLVALLVLLWKLVSRAVNSFVQDVHERFRRGEERMDRIEDRAEEDGTKLAVLISEHRLRHGDEPIHAHQRFGDRPHPHRRDSDPEGEPA